MLSTEENEYLCRTGPGTPMGNLLRRYWLPVMLSSEIPEPDCPPVRVRVMSEDLVAFRDTTGQVGLIAANCAHRGASLFFGRNEECGIRCVYHGWKYDVSGQCVDMPNEPAESNFKNKIEATAYPIVEEAGLVWAYMGPREKQPPFRHFVPIDIPNDQWQASKIPVYCNYVQSMEGNIDSAHISFLHRNFVDFEPVHDGTDEAGYPSLKMSNYVRASSRAPRLEVEDTEYGFRYAALRRTPSGLTHVRMSLHVLPIFTFVANPLPDQSPRIGLTLVPADDASCWRFSSTLVTDESFPLRPGQNPSLFLDDQGQRARRADNDYLLDRGTQRTVNYTGILGVANQDYAVTESMGAIYDRSQEHLGTTDLAIIRLRQQLIEAARNLERGIDPPGVYLDLAWDRLRSEERVLAPGENWRTLGTEQDPSYRELMGAGGR